MYKPKPGDTLSTPKITVNVLRVTQDRITFAIKAPHPDMGVWWMPIKRFVAEVERWTVKTEQGKLL